MAMGIPGGGAVGGMGMSPSPPSFQNLTYAGLVSKYHNFEHPCVEVTAGGEPIVTEKNELVINDFHIELSAGFEASIASFRIYNVLGESDDMPGHRVFLIDSIEKQLTLGNALQIRMGYLGTMETVFLGFIAGISLAFDMTGVDSLPHVEVTAMDIKGLMMSGSYAQQCKAEYYSAAVEEVLARTSYTKLKQAGAYLSVKVDKTPDAPKQGGGQKETAYKVELVSESDYEFVVKAAKKFNFEFFVDRGEVLFREAKKDKKTLMTLSAGEGISRLHVEYSITGLIGEIEARAMDAGKAELIMAKDKFPGTEEKLGEGSTTKGIVAGGSKVYIDPTIETKEQAEVRVASLREKMAYQLGSLEALCVGIPELMPGRFFNLEKSGKLVDNQFYLYKVEHSYDDQRGFMSKIYGKAKSVEPPKGAGGAGGLV